MKQNAWGKKLDGYMAGALKSMRQQKMITCSFNKSNTKVKRKNVNDMLY